MGLFDFIGSQQPEDVERRLRLAQGLSGMSLNPNAGLQQSIKDRLEGIQKQREKTADQEADSKRRKMAVKLLGGKFPMLAGALQAGIISPADAITSAKKGADVKVVGKSLVASDGTVIYSDHGPTDDKTTAFQTLHQKAIAGGLKEGTPDYNRYMLEGGAKKGLSVSIGADGSVQISEGGGKPVNLTESQGKATGFYDRARQANEIIAGVEGQGTNFGQALLGIIPFDAANWAKSPERQQYEQAKRDFINTVLRQESGAAIGKDEFTSADKQYFPQVGDSSQVIAQKRQNRETVANALKIISGAGATLLNTSTPTNKAPTSPMSAIDNAIADLEGN